MVKLLLNDEKAVVSQNNGSELSECKTETEVFEYIEKMNDRLDKDAEVFVMTSDLPISEAKDFMISVFDSHEVLPKNVFEYGMKNLDKLNKDSELEGFEDVEFTDNKIENRARLQFLYYGSQHYNEVRKARKRLQRMQEDYYEVFSGKTTLLDYLGRDEDK